jgi:hypothetical protein
MAVGGRVEPEARIAEGWIGRYAIQARIGEGGMAETWLCRAPDGAGSHGATPVVVKTLRPGCRSRQYQTMFRDEGMVGVALHHPNLAQVFEFGTCADGPYLVQQYVDGPNVMQLIRAQQVAGSFDPRLAARIIADAAVALDHVYHACDGEGRPLYVVHRDVSPSNILVGSDGVTRLIDFGVAMYVGREARTESGVLKGKIQFMAPEVLLEQDWSHRSDLYSLGIVLHWLLVGRGAVWDLPESDPSGHPTATTSRPREADVLARLRGRLRPPSTHRPDLPPALEEVVRRCLEVQPSRRYARGLYLAEALEDWMRSDDGLVSDAEVAARMAPLFEDPQVDWRGCHDFTVSAGPIAVTSAAPQRRAVAVSVGLMAVAAAAFGVSLLALGAISVARAPIAPNLLVGEIGHADIAAEDAAEVDLAEIDHALNVGDLDLAHRGLVTLSVPHDDPRRAAREARYAHLRHEADLAPPAGPPFVAPPSAERPSAIAPSRANEPREMAPDLLLDRAHAPEGLGWGSPTKGIVEGILESR